MNPPRQVCLIGCPMDFGAGRRGVGMGPSALRIAGITEQLGALGHVVSDWGDIDTRVGTEAADDPQLRHLPQVAAVCEALSVSVALALGGGVLPVVLGGDHSMSIGTLGGIAGHLRPGGQRLGVLWVDAHADINTPETSPSGNIHGMPLAVALGEGHAQLTAIGGNEPSVLPDHLVYLGLRSVDAGERDAIRRLGIRAYTMADIDRRGIAAVSAEALDHLLAGCDHLHVSFDLDVADPVIAPGVGTPVPGGLTYREAHYLMEAIAESGRLASLELAEVNPALDMRNACAELAVGLAASALGQRVI